MQTILSFDLKGDFGFFKKPDVNDNKRTPYLSYNMLHKPALLGILGAIVGLEGYQKKGELPEYYRLLRHLPVGIAPVPGAHEQGNFQKTTLTYNNSVGYASQEQGGNLMVTESMLIRPAYRCYLALNTENPVEAKLRELILAQQAEFLPYFGKNEFAVWWSKEEVREYAYEPVATPPAQSFEIRTLFVKENLNLREQQQANTSIGFDLLASVASTFAYFERLPVIINESLFQYEWRNFVFTNFRIKAGSQLSSLYYLSEANAYAQLI
jgi:CRISPR-associated protein Cas5h